MFIYVMILQLLETCLMYLSSILALSAFLESAEKEEKAVPYGEELFISHYSDQQ